MQNLITPAYFPKPSAPEKITQRMWLIAMAAILTAVVITTLSSMIGILPAFSLPEAVGKLLNRGTTSQAGITTDAKTGRLILFKTHNGRETDGQAAESRMIPHLILFANETLTDAASRTINVEIRGVQVPAGGGNLVVRIETQHGDPDHSSTDAYRIPVSETTTRLENHSQRVRLEQNIEIEYTFSEITPAGIPTPADYYRVVAVFSPSDSGTALEQQLSLEYAFLLENQWITSLAELQAKAGDAAPEELVIFYLDMTPFQISAYRPDARLARAEVRPFVQNVLAPGMVEAIERHTLEWGFEWSENWTSFRGEEDARRISVALTQTGLWFHGQAPAGGYATITINVKQTELKTFNSLVDWILTIFSHELFHNQQRSINQALGGTGEIDGEFEAWEFVTEGTAVVAESVFNPQLGFEHGSAVGPYFSRAKKFIAGGENTTSSLNSSYNDISPYEAAIYWRFLYEQCGGLQNGMENPATGLTVIFATLEELYADENLLNIQPEEMTSNLAELMDRVFSKVDACPFADFRSSLLAFHRAIYGLGVGAAVDADAEFTNNTLYDPQDHLPAPEVASVLADGRYQIFEERIGGGYGVDFIEVKASGIFRDNGFRIEFINTEADPAVFTVQIWMIPSQSQESRPPSTSRLVELGEIRAGERVSEEFLSSDDGTDLITAVLVSRIDGQESTSTSGGYRLVVTPR